MAIGGASFLLDANVFIEAARRYYAFDLVPAFWQELVHHAENGHIVSLDRVKNELSKGKDQLACWAKKEFNLAFIPTGVPNVINAYKLTMAWVQSQPQYSDAAKSKFAAGADGWLVAYALATGCTIVTQEVPAPSAQNKVPLPNVCVALNVSWTDTFEMLRRLGIRFT